MLGLDQLEEVVAEGEDVPPELGGVEVAVLPTQPGLDLLGDALVGEDPLARSPGGVVAPGHLGALAGLVDQLCCGEKKLVCGRSSA